jgi:hypothetical protein
MKLVEYAALLLVVASGVLYLLESRLMARALAREGLG